MPQASSPTSIIPTAPGLPLLGNAVEFLRDPLGFFCDARARHGDVVRVAFGPMRMIVVYHPDLVEDVLVTRNALWQKDVFLRTTLRPVLGDGLLASDGAFWRRQRRLAQPAFHRERIAAYAGTMVEQAERLAARWRDGEARDVHQDMMALTLEVVARALFGASVGDHADAVRAAIEGVLGGVADPVGLLLPFTQRIPLPRKKRFERAVARLDAIVYGLIERRRRGGDDARADDLLSMLLEARDEDGAQMSDAQLRDECMTLFLAGHETTALNLSWTWLLLAEHPAVDARLARELDEVLGERPATIADVPRLAYTRHVIAESLRLYPPAWSLARAAREDLELGGHRVARDEHVWFPPWAIHRDARWFDDPHAFRPERWEGDLAKTLPRFAYFPFGGGPRLCIGQAFAQTEAVLILATLARSFRVEVAEPARVVPDPSVTLRPKHGLPARIRARRR